jgi:MoaA/NifB/PqqE/SkfB family radical SAM enzyme
MSRTNMIIKDHLRLLAQGGPGFVNIALTNACNAKCRFCSFPQVKPSDRVMADPGRLRRGLHLLAATGVRYVVYTGGEPLLYPHLPDILGEARELGIQNLLCTNGRLLNRDKVDALQKAGVSHLIISIDAASESEHDNHRGFPGLCRTIQDLLPEIKRSGMKPVASVTISRLFSDFEVLGKFLDYLGFQLVTFSYPLTTLNSSYLSYAADDAVTFSDTEMVDIFQGLKDWMSQAPVTVLNPSLAMTELQRQLCGRPLRFPCLAGYKYFYIDWHLNVYRCTYLQKVLGPLEDFAALPRVRDDCHACTVDCYRDASVQQYLAVVLGDVWEELRRGEWGQALRRLLHPDNVLSLGAVLESRHWLGRKNR